MAHNRKDDLNLSLTGSHMSAVSVRSTSSRPTSAHTKRANSLVDVRQNKQCHQPPGETVAAEETRQQNRTGSLKAETSSTSSQHTASNLPATHSMKNPVNETLPKRNRQEDDFLALFENSAQPKIKRPSSGTSSSALKKKPSASAMKVLWNEPKPKMKSKKPAWSSKPSSENNTTRSEEPHNIFHPSSVHSSEDDLDNRVEMMEELGNSLSQSFNKLQTLQNQLSGVNKQTIDSRSGNNLTLDSYRSGSSISTLTPGVPPHSDPQTTSVDDFIQDIMDRTTRSNGQVENISRSRSMLSSYAMQRLLEGEDGAYVSSSLANNISRPGQMQKVKASLSSMENSYQNFKRKTPVNQVKSSVALSGCVPSNVTANQSSTNSSTKPRQQSTVGCTSNSFNKQKPKPLFDSSVQKSLAQNMAEDYVSRVNSAATAIQKWYRRHKTRRTVAEAALKRLLDQKKKEHEIQRQQELAQSMTSGEVEERNTEERKKMKEEKAKEARQKAVKDLQKKREDRKNEVKKLAEDEVKYLQASGKITKNSSGSSLPGKKESSNLLFRFLQERK